MYIRNRIYSTSRQRRRQSQMPLFREDAERVVGCRGQGQVEIVGIGLDTCHKGLPGFIGPLIF
jgi:hypothetical protein